METLAFFDPSGNTEVTRAHAPRLTTLEGKRIGFLSNDQWQAFRTLPLIETMIQEDFPSCEVLPLDTFPPGIGPMASKKTAMMVKERGVDAVIIGNGA
ncbi:MAG: hypothetical protein FP816_16010 [Desulfobacteraceae bacterium]|nr:hypothetical protein [Desulfobacteraceae bacterium]MBU4001852.1 hypothetical protein [Pseudomonadota bacterium]MBU4052848.1 hypothetical protein [Pseudomonadota bacterium]